MRARNLMIRATAVLVAFAMLALSGGLAWAAAGDFTERDRVPSGVTVAGVGLGGLSAEEAHDAIESTVVEPLLAPVTVRVAELSFRIDPADFLQVDVERAVSAAFEPNRSATLVHRIYRRLLDEPVEVTVEPEIVVDEEALAARVSGIAASVDREPRDATLGIENDVVVIGPSSEGRRLDQETSTALIAKALRAGDTDVELPIAPLLPETAEKDLGRWLVVHREERTLELWEGAVLDRVYRITVGAAGYETPRGEWEITLKRYMPSWGNPGSEWARNMPQTIPPGPGNPLGTRALNLNIPGIRIHGTQSEASIGAAASHGCIRLRRADIEELFELVEVGTPVFVVAR